MYPSLQCYAINLPIWGFLLTSKTSIALLKVSESFKMEAPSVEIPQCCRSSAVKKEIIKNHDVKEMFLGLFWVVPHRIEL